MQKELEQLEKDALEQAAKVPDMAALEHLRVQILGRKGSLTALSEGMRNLSKEERPQAGQMLNRVRESITQALAERQDTLRIEFDRSAATNLDVSLPGDYQLQGSCHPMSKLLAKAVDVLRQQGFALAVGPEVETEFHCFDALNTPADHPARNEKDTFYFEDGRLLRTHTSTVQIRTMETQLPPLRVIAPGTVFRRDEMDATHLPQFHQLEGLYVDKDVSLGHLIATLEHFYREMLGPDAEVRLRPHFFPFTEPSFEVDVRAKALAGGERWLEMAGCGMVDPAVFEAVNGSRGDQAYDPNELTGFAFGLGLDRLAMVLYQIPDIRMLIENDLRFLRQFVS
ncbi:MAG: phenylalanine--tRNA ligase subunit alpha [Verrucomicrobiales bacterium]